MGKQKREATQRVSKMASVARRRVVASARRCSEDDAATAPLNQDRRDFEAMLSFDLLQAASEVAYDERLHAGLLEKVWSVAFPGEAFKRVSDKWKHIGFQQCDPVSDLRGSGVLGL